MNNSIIYILAMNFLFLACSHHAHESKLKSIELPRVSTTMSAKSGSNVSGDLEFTQEKNGVKLVVSLRGLSPNSLHGFHIHQKGDCSAPDAKSAGGHFNPEGHKHGSPYKKSHHLGDLGNLKTNSKGYASKSFFIKGARLGGDSKLSILNRAVIVHKKNDDLKSQPSGNAGPRIGCAAIRPKTN